jgi:hypothetical protein
MIETQLAGVMTKNEQVGLATVDHDARIEELDNLVAGRDTITHEELLSALPNAELEYMRPDDLLNVYLAEMSQEPLLTFPEEVLLA